MFLPTDPILARDVALVADCERAFIDTHGLALLPWQRGYLMDQARAGRRTATRRRR